MNRTGRLLVRTRALIAGALLVSMTACTTMAPVAGPREFIPIHEPSVVWVKRSNVGQTMALEGPRIIGDTIVGFVDGEYTELPLVEVQSVRAKQFSRGKTTAFILGMAALTVGLSFVISGGVGSHDELLEEGDIGFRSPRPSIGIRLLAR